MTISQDLPWYKHVENIMKKAGKRLYKLYQLKRARITCTDKNVVSVYFNNNNKLFFYSANSRMTDRCAVQDI